MYITETVYKLEKTQYFTHTHHTHTTHTVMCLASIKINFTVLYITHAAYNLLLVT